MRFVRILETAAQAADVNTQGKEDVPRQHWHSWGNTQGKGCATPTLAQLGLCEGQGMCRANTVIAGGMRMARYVPRQHCSTAKAMRMARDVPRQHWHSWGTTQCEDDMS